MNIAVLGRSSNAARTKLLADRWQQWFTLETLVSWYTETGLRILINNVQENGLLRSEKYAGIFSYPW